MPVGEPLRPEARGKFLFLGERKLYVRGVTYGTFRPGSDGSGYPAPEVVRRDFAEMAASGINTVRTYTVPPRWLLDLAHRHGLLVMVGIAWEGHVAFLDDAGRPRSIEERVRAGVRSCAGHPAVLCYTIGNEIPAALVRWHGRRRVERFLERLYRAAKSEDPGALVTYVNYPSTEYLELPFVDFVCFNVYLEREEELGSYLARLQNLAGDRPLVMGELGLDSRSYGEETQALVLAWQVRTAFAAGCAGAVVFSWTDEWHRGGHDIDGWDFGLTDRRRRPKPALTAVRDALADVPFRRDVDWPFVSVVVCTYNGAATLRECLEGLLRLDYPSFEAIVVDDGSTDESAAIAAEYGVRVISTENRGLSSARNTGLRAAAGEIVAYLDDDASPDRHWLMYLAAAFHPPPHAGIGGPNIPPPGEGAIAESVGNAPGGPMHVLLSDEEAEHIPGCNMAFRKALLEEVGGFDPQFRVAGDDVDICWRLQERGWTLGFSPAAVVWHRRRNSLRGFFSQQREYGKAEALLERKWPERYNRSGHVAWAGRVYATSSAHSVGRGWRIYYGTWGSALFQSVYQRSPRTLASLPLMPEWYLVILALLLYTGLGAHWKPLLLTLPLLVGAVGALVVQAALGGVRASFAAPPPSAAARLGRRGLTALLYLLQPLARLSGRLRHGLTPWRRRDGAGLALPLPRTRTLWSESWLAPEERLRLLEAALRARATAVIRGGEFDRWDLHVRSGSLGAARLRLAVEEHGAGHQLVRVRVWPRWSRGGALLTLLLVVLSLAAALGGAWVAGLLFGSFAAAVVVRALHESASATAGVLSVLEEPDAAGDLARALGGRVEEAKAAQGAAR